MDNVVRIYEADDCEDVVAAWETASRLAHPFLTPAFLEKERHNIRTLFLPYTETWIVEQEGCVAGFMCIVGNEVGLLFVRPEAQRRGAGRALLDTARDVHGDLEVEVFKANAVGCAFYAHYGFEIVCEKLHEETGDALYRMKYTAAGRTP